MMQLSRFSKLIFLALICLLLFAPQILPSVLADDATDVLTLVNNERTSRGLAPLTLCARLNTAAQNHTNDMIARQFFDHTNPDGITAGDRITTTGYSWTAYGENIAVGYPTPQAVVNGWMNSPGHKANILNPSYTGMGLGSATGNYMGSPNSKYWTQDFGRGGVCDAPKIDLAVTISDAPDPVTASHNLTYSVVVTNNGPTSATQAKLTQQLPSGPSFVSAVPGQGTCNLPSGLTVNCTLGVINAGNSVTVTIIITPATTGSLTTSSYASSTPEHNTNAQYSRTWAITDVLPPPPDAPMLIAPTGTLASVRPTFSWTAPTGAARYEIQIGKTNPPTTPIISVTTNSYTPPGPMIPGDYFWQVRAFNAGGVPSDNWSLMGSFTLTSPDGAAPLLHYAASQPVTLTWNRILNVTGYDVEIADNPGMTNPIIQDATTALFYSPSALPSGTYYWHVRGKVGSTPGGWSTAEILVVK